VIARAAPYVDPIFAGPINNATPHSSIETYNPPDKDELQALLVACVGGLASLHEEPEEPPRDTLGPRIRRSGHREAHLRPPRRGAVALVDEL